GIHLRRRGGGVRGGADPGTQAEDRGRLRAELGLRMVRAARFWNLSSYGESSRGSHPADNWQQFYDSLARRLACRLSSFRRSLRLRSRVSSGSSMPLVCSTVKDTSGLSSASVHGRRCSSLSSKCK